MTAPIGGHDALSARIALLQAADRTLSPLGAAIISALEFSIATDSRAIAKAFDVEHALVLREIAALEGTGHVIVAQRDARTLRTKISLA